VGQLFTTGNNSGGYTLSSIELLMAGAAGAPSGFSVSLFDAGGRDPGSTELENLSGSANPATAGVFAYASSGLVLAPSTGYWIIATADTVSTIGNFNWSSGGAAGLISQNGWFVNVGAVSSTSGASWSQTTPFQFAIYATPVPEPSSLALLFCGGALVAGYRYRHRWAS
jgi:hypothetical protein